MSLFGHHLDPKLSTNHLGGFDACIQRFGAFVVLRERARMRKRSAPR